MPKNEINGSIPVKKSKILSLEKKDVSKDFSLNDFLKIELNHLSKSEKKLVEYFPELLKKLNDEDLEEILTDIHQQTIKQQGRLERVMLKFSINDSLFENCEVINAHINDSNRVLNQFQDGPVRDAAIIVQMQKILHHKIASYGSVCEIAYQLRHLRIAETLDRSLEECEESDIWLTKISEDVNADACEEVVV